MPMKTNKNSVDMDNSLVVNRRKGRKEMIETHSNMIKRMTTWHPKLGFKATALLGT